MVSKALNTQHSLKALTPKQNNFARLVASGNTLSDAYRNSYNAENMHPKTVNEEASRLGARPDIAARIDQLNAEKDRALTVQALSTRETLLDKLAQIADGSLFVDAIQLKAIELQGKAMGLFESGNYVEPAKLDSGQIMAQLEARLAELLSDNPQLKPVTIDQQIDSLASPVDSSADSSELTHDDAMDLSPEELAHLDD